MSKKSKKRRKLAQFRLSIIGALLSVPPDKGHLQKELESIAQRLYFHPLKKVWKKYGVTTIERWYYRARDADDPIEALSAAGSSPKQKISRILQDRMNWKSGIGGQVVRQFPRRKYGNRPTQ